MEGKNFSKYSEIIKLHNMLDSECIGHVFRQINNGFQVVYPSLEAWDEVLRIYESSPRDRYFENSQNCMSAVENEWSYGHSSDLLEVMGMLKAGECNMDEVAVMTASEAFKRISCVENRKHHKPN